MRLGQNCGRRPVPVPATGTIIVGAVAAWFLGAFVAPAVSSIGIAAAQPSPNPAAAPVLELNDKQLSLLKIGSVSTRLFPLQQAAIGTIDFNQDQSVQTFAPYQGKIISTLAEMGAEVGQGAPLFTVESSDFLQAESTLVAAAGVYDMTNRALSRARKLYATQGTGGIAAKDLDQAVSDQQSAEGALKSARDAVGIFGKTDAEVDAIIAQRRIDPVLVVRSPIAGRITARNAQPGLFVQPGNAPAPYTVTNLSTIWMLANVAEVDSPGVRIGQLVKVSVLAYPGRVYGGTITTVAPSVDSSLHTLQVRSVVQDPQHELRPGMFARFLIQTGDPVTGIAVPVDGVVREGDGKLTAWV
jgi:membrane fusion protein, heavy metal efflux system